jgi:hypothetical protein
MTESEAVIQELREIKYHLSLLTFDLRTKAARRFAEEILGTDGRRKMWDALDGVRTTTEIGKTANVSSQAVRDLFQDRTVSRFLKVQTVNNALIGARDMDAVMDWYLDVSSKS